MLIYIGIGFEIITQLVQKGCLVYMCARNQEKASEAIQKIQNSVPLAKIKYIKMDMQDLKSVQKGAKEFLELESHLDLLINNAGIMAQPFSLSADGIEAQFATNHLGHHLLTNQLLPALLAAPEKPRIVNLSSGGHWLAPSAGICDLNQINDPAFLNDVSRYGQSKLANILHARGFDKRYGDKIIINSLHPGWVNTELYGHMKSSTFSSFAQHVNSLLALTPLQGALTALYVATSPDIVKNDWRARYFAPIAYLEKPSKQGVSDVLSEKLWTMSESLISEKLE